MSYFKILETSSLENKLEILKNKWDEIVKQFSALKDKEVFDKLIKTDPTKNKQYLQWIITKGISGWKKQIVFSIY